MLRALTALALSATALTAAPPEWPQFRGPAATGVADDQKPPTQIGADKNVLWKVPVPSGFSSPVVAGDRLFLTAFDDGKLFTIAYSRENGKELWRKQAKADKDEEMRLEIFSPPYFFKDARPLITAAPQAFHYGETITVRSPQAMHIKWVTLIRNGVTTHSFDSGQRLVDLDVVSRTADAVHATVTPNTNLAPPGWYMLFIVDEHDVPSTSEWVHVS